MNGHSERIGKSLRPHGEPDIYSQAIINSLEDELMVIDKDYRIVQANGAVLRRLRKRAEKVIGEHCYYISHNLPEPCHPPYHECPIRTVWETGRPTQVTHIHKYDVDNQRQEKYINIVASPITDTQGNVIAVTELMRDVTEAKEIELRLAAAHRYFSALNAVTSVVIQSLDLDTIISSALERTLEIMRLDTGSILLLDEQKQRLCYRVHHGLSNDSIRGLCVQIGEGINGMVAQTGESIVVEDIQMDPRVANNDIITTQGLRAFVSVPLRSKDKVLGTMNVADCEARRFSSEDIQLLENIAVQIAVAVENANLHQDVQRQDENRGELLREIFSIQEEERKRIARELHDETTQALASLAASLEAVTGMLPDGATEARTRLQQLKSLTISILDEIHRLIYELRPSLLDDLGLVAASRWLVENNLEAVGITSNFKIIGRQRRLSPKLETILFRVTQEAISNIAKHSRARNVDVTLRFLKTAIRVHVEDDGIGFDFEEAIRSKNRPRGLGLLGMRERIELMNGTFYVCSHPGGGTEIDVEIPLSGKAGHG